jgi:capsid protein
VAGPYFESYVNSSDTIFVGGDDDDDVEARRVAEEQAEIQAKLVNDTGEQEQMRQDYERLQEEVQAMKQAGSSSRSMEPKR